MAKEIYDLRNKLRQLKFENQILQKIDCSKADSKKYAKLIKDGGELPDGVFQYKSTDGSLFNEFYTVYDSGLTDSEKIEYLMMKQLESVNYLYTIKNCLVLIVLFLIVFPVIIYFLLLIVSNL